MLEIDAPLLLALAQSGARIGAAASLAEWRTILRAEVGAYLPGATCVIDLATDGAPAGAAPADSAVVMPLLAADRWLGRLAVQGAPAGARAATEALLAVLTPFAAFRLTQLPDRARPALDAGLAERGLLRRLQNLAQIFTTALDPQALFDEVVSLAMDLTAGDTATLLLDEPGGRGLLLQAECGHPGGARPRCYLGRWGVAGLVIGRDEIVVIDHALSDTRYAAPAFGRPAKSLLGVPLRQGGKVIGSLNVSNGSAYFAFGQHHVELLLLLAHYAAVGIEIASLRSAREQENEQLQRQNAVLTGLYERVSRTAHEQSALNAVTRCIQSTPDLEEAFPCVLGVLGELVQVESAEIYLAPPRDLAAPAAGAAAAAGGAAARCVAQWGRPRDRGGAARQMTVPLRRGADELGRLVLARSAAGGPFAAQDRAVAAAVADQLALALENRSLIVRDLAALAAAPPGRRTPLDLTQLLLRLLTQTQAIGAVDGAAALLYDAETDDWQVAAALGALPATWPVPPTPQRALLDDLRRTGAAVRQERAPAAGGGLLWLIPMLADDRLIGALALPGRPGSSLAAKVPFLSALAARAGVMIHNIQLQWRSEELLILEERQSIAHEMHDGLAQTLTQIRLHGEYVGRILASDPDRARAELEQMQGDLRTTAGALVRVIQALAPPVLGQEGLRAALPQLGAAFARPGHLEVEVRVPPFPGDLPPQVELTLFRVAQEWLRDLAWHPEVSRCRLVLTCSGDAVVLTIDDNAGAAGRALDAAAARPAPSAGRLHLLRDQVTERGGRLGVGRSDDGGTQLLVTLPLPAAGPH